MKAIISILFLCILPVQSFQSIQGTETFKGVFVAYRGEAYHFIDKDGESLVFHKIKKRVLDNFCLQDDYYKGRNFTITYERDTEKSEEGDDLLINIITGLELSD